MASSFSSNLLKRLGLDRKELWAWAMYDWANSAFVLIIITAVFPIYYQTVAAATLDSQEATALFARVTGVALALVAMAAPVLGAIADSSAVRKKLLGLFLVTGVMATGCLFLIREGDWLPALLLFAVGNLSVSATFVFYDALLPHVASRDEMDRVSAAGYALGYLGSGLLLIFNILWIQNPGTFGFADAGAATRATFLGVALWWGIFSIPLFRNVKEPPGAVSADGSGNAIRRTVNSLRQTFRDLRTHYRQAARMLFALLVYNDGIGTIIRMAAIFAASIGLPQEHIIVAIVLVQFVGIPATVLFGWIAERIGAKRAIFVGLAVYTVITLVAFVMTSVVEFYILAVLVGLVQGGTQALSRSLFASMIPKHKSTEFFGFFSVFEKFAGIFGPIVFSMMISIAGSTRDAILSITFFFALGAILLSRVRVQEGQEAARRAEQ